MSTVPNPLFEADPMLEVRIEKALTHVTASSAGQILGEWSSSIAARDLADFWIKFWTQRGYSMFSIKALTRELLDELRERILMAIMDAEDKKLQKELEKEFPPSDDIPEGPVITVDPNDFRVPKVLMKPSLIGLDQEGIQHLIARAIQACDPLLQPGLWNNVTLTGPFARVEGLVETLQSELSSLAPEGIPVRVRIA